MMKRREFIMLIGGAAALWPLAARAQQPAMPVVGFFYSGTLTDVPHFVAAFRQGLKETDFIEGQNVVIEYRSAEDQADPLPALVADLARRQVALIVGNTPSTLAAKAATTTVPIVFVTGFDPVRNGLVTNLNRPGGNVTGISFMSVELAAKSWRSCVSCGREPRALPCSSIPNSPLPSGFSQRSGLRLRPSGSNSLSSMSAATAKSRPPLQLSCNVGLARCTWAAACCPNGNGLSRWRPDTEFPRSMSCATTSLPAA